MNESTTLAELRKLPLSEVIQALKPEFTPATVERQGQFGNVWSRNITLPEVGSVHPGHCHNFDHRTYVVYGAIHVKAFRVDPATQRPIVETVVERNFKAPAMVNIRKDMWHTMTALEPNTMVQCVYAMRDKDGDVVQEWDGRMDPFF